ncbi:MAG: DUF2807 domain-containing protein [Bacteroidales bacterium]|jgi:hypothetical protein|nr:DUF2807 domain-containing protein [Bacteroidales bacterium]
MKNQAQKNNFLPTFAAAIAILFISCSTTDYGKYELIERDIPITGTIKGIIIEGPWEVTVTQNDNDNSAFIQYNAPDNKIKAELRPNGILHLKLYNRSSKRNIKLTATINAAELKTIDGSGAAIIYTYENFTTSADINLSGASLLCGFYCEGDKEVINLSGSSIMKKCTFIGKRIDATLSGGSNVTYSNIEVDKCKVDVSGSSIFTGSGYAEETDFNGSGGSTFFTFELESENLDIDLSGSSEGEVNVLHKIKGTLSGSSILKYKKAEDVSDVTLTGGSKIIKE